MPGNPLLDINNLSDVINAATARMNLDVDSKGESEERVDNLKDRLSASDGSKLVGLSVGTAYDALRALTPEMYINSGLFSGVTMALNQLVIDAAANSVPINAYNGIYALTSGQTLLIQDVEWYGGTLVGTGNTIVKIKNASLEKLSFSKCGIRHIGGNFFARNIAVENSTATAAILISNLDSPGIVEISEIRLSNNNYGVLGQGSTGSPVTRLLINNFSASEHKGDPIELNLVQTWGRIEIRNVVIDSVTGTGIANDYWGIGIGIAGAGNYALQTPDADMASNILIENVFISGCRQPIHLEKSRNFTLRNLQLYPDDTINTAAGLIPTGISVVGCREFTIEQFSITPVNIDTTPAITTSWGVISGGVYSGPCRNFTIRDGETSGNLALYTGASSDVGSYVDISDISAWAGGSFLKGYLSDLRIKGLSANSLKIDMAHTTGEGVGILTRNSQISCYFDGVISQDKNGEPNGLAQHIYADSLEVVGCNFPISKAAIASGARGSLVQPARVLHAPGTAFPVGIPFVQGDIIFRTSSDPAISGSGWVITTSGAQVNSTDAIKAAVAGQNYIESYTPGLNWAGLNQKTGGLRLTIAGAGTAGSALQSTVTRAPFVANGVYRVTIDPPIVTDIPDGTLISATNPVAFSSFGTTTASAVPTTGAHVLGEKVWNNAPIAGGFIGWVCITSGIPGVWKGFGEIQA